MLKTKQKVYIFMNKTYKSFVLDKAQNPCFPGILPKMLKKRNKKHNFLSRADQ